MTHDFSHRSKDRGEKRKAKKKTKRVIIPAWLWLLAGLSAGVASTLFLSNHINPATATFIEDSLSAEELASIPADDPTTEEQNAQAEVSVAPAATQNSQTETTATETTNSTDEAANTNLKFEFYTILSEQEVMVDELHKVKKAASNSQKPVVVASKQEANSSIPQYYTLQAGSFLNIDDAQRLHDKIHNSGLAVIIEKSLVSRNNMDTTWYRVIVGPYNNSAAIEQAKSTLSSLSIDTLLIRRKQ